MDMGRNSRFASLSFEGNSLDVLKSWPKAVRSDFGLSLREMQEGRTARLDTRRMESIGKGVFELKDSDDCTWYRMIYLTRIHNVIYILDCFTKDTAKTEKKDLNRAAQRLAQLKQRLQQKR